MAHTVNLDALIERADLEISIKMSQRSPNFSLGELDSKKTMFGVLRKPDFQRETKEWKPEQIVELVKNFLDGELIPAIITWESPSRLVYVIDGAHRLSALIAWVNNDYGAGHLSQKFFGANEIPTSQRKAARITQQLMESQVGSYAFLESLTTAPEKGTELQRGRAIGLAGLPIETQAIKSSDAFRAERSFYRINQGGAIINEDEKEIIRARKRAEAVAARALLRAGTGHKYWSHFPDKSKQDAVEKLARECFELLYKPELPEQIRTLELPVAGKGYSSESLSVMYEFIHIANHLQREPRNRRNKKDAFDPLPENDPRADKTGDTTIEYLTNVKGFSELITSNKPKSLGLHPAVYVYTKTGRFLPAAFFAEVLWVEYLDTNKWLHIFTTHRKRFEDYLVKNKHFINQISHDFGGGMKSADPILHMYKLILDSLKRGETDAMIRRKLKKDSRIGNALAKADLKSAPPEQGDFKKLSAAAVRLKTELDSASCCPECKARNYPRATTIDHIERDEDGGLPDADNGQVMHPFCNSGVKERRISAEKKAKQQT
jgi:hypothetical protein